MKSALFIYPNQLYKAEHFPEVDEIYVIEEPLLFGTDEEHTTWFHRAKLVLLRSAARRYVEEVVWPLGKPVEYFDIETTTWSGQPIIKAIESGITKIYIFDLLNDLLWRRLNDTNKEQQGGIEFVKLDSPGFYLSNKDLSQFFSDNSKMSFNDFYQWQRERFNILIDEDYRPRGGKWLAEGDSANLSGKDSFPGVTSFGENDYVSEAVEYVNAHFPNNPGSLDSFIWPTSHQEAEEWLADFLKVRLGKFSQYQNVISQEAVWLYHSLMSASLNIGLLTPQMIVQSTLDYSAKNDIALDATESFIRQILGWREYARGLYWHQGAKMISSNVFKNERKLTQHWYDGTTSIKPLDDVINKVNEHAYALGSERLWIAGNLMLLCEIQPAEAYKWFHSLFIDAYEWVTVPNVYSLSQFADGGSMAAKPNIAASSYLLGVSDYQKDDWCDVWDGLFWRFVDNHRNYLSHHPRSGGVLIKRLDSMDEARRRIIGYRANDFLDNFTGL